MATSKFVLVGGGVRSGKSAFALERARAFGDQLVFVATAEALDDEMRERADRHRAERGQAFRTVECPRELVQCLRGLTDVDGVVIDCLTLWISNLMMAGLSAAEIDARVVELADCLRSVDFQSVLVSNEVGLGIVPDNAMARAFRDATGRAHQVLGRAANELYFGVMGQLLRIKPAPLELVGPSA
jgi:adenosylcobinamide kinase/adenosylcobinamide-phosphate guanylyltransferase